MYTYFQSQLKKCVFFAKKHVTLHIRSFKVVQAYLNKDKLAVKHDKCYRKRASTCILVKTEWHWNICAAYQCVAVYSAVAKCMQMSCAVSVYMGHRN